MMTQNNDVAHSSGKIQEDEKTRMVQNGVYYNKFCPASDTPVAEELAVDSNTMTSNSDVSSLFPRNTAGTRSADGVQGVEQP